MRHSDPDAQRDADRQRFLAEASHVLSASLDYAETLQRLAELAVPRIAAWCGIYIADAEGTLRLAEVAPNDEAQRAFADEMLRRFSSDQQAVEDAYQVLHTGRSELRSLGDRAALTVPLRARGRTFGVIQLLGSENWPPYTLEDIAFVEDFAARAALATDNARLFQLAQRRQREESALRAATEAVTASFSVDEIIRQIAHSAIEATLADGSFVERIVGTEVEVVAIDGKLHPPQGARAPFQGSFAQKVVESGQPTLLHHLSDEPRQLPGVLGTTIAQARALFVPLVDGGEAIGALVLLREPEREPFTLDEAERAHTFGNLAALAFRKVHLLADSERRRDEMEQIAKSRSHLMRGFTHDLKNPIGAADGHAALLEEGLVGELTEQQLHSVRRIRASLQNALKLIDDLSEFARAETDRIEIRPAPTQIIEIARELGEAYRGIAEQAGITMELELHRIPIIISDDDRIRQILGNLLSNAVKYTKRGGRIIVRTQQRVDENGHCVIAEVEDSGIGIPADKMHLLFEEFERIDPSVQPGLGLGLAISRRVARALGGDIAVHSERGRGSRFTLWLPNTASEHNA